jgi:hypothetical protein
MLRAKIQQSDARVKMLKEFAKLKDAIKFRKPMTSSANVPGQRVDSPVQWTLLEPKTGLAKGETVGQQEPKTHQPSAPQSKRPTTAHPARGKFAAMFPPRKSRLRPQSASTRSKTGQLSLAAHTIHAAPTQSAMDVVKKNLMQIAGATEEDKGLDEHSLETFLTQARPVDTCSGVTTGHTSYIAPVRRKFEHLDSKRVHEIIQGLPIACDGRMMVSADLKQVLEKRESGLKQRIIHQVRKLKQEPDNDYVKRNTDHVQTTDVKLLKLKESADRMDIRAQASRQIRERKEQERSLRALESIRRHELAMQRKRAIEENLHRADLQRHLLAVMMFAFKTSRFFHTVRRWHHYKPIMIRKRWAVLKIEKFYLRVKSRQFSKRRTQALFTLAIVFSRCIRRWQIRYRGRKAHVIITYLREQRQTAKIQVAVKRFRTKVVVAQNRMRRNQMISNARYQLLEMQWDKIDNERQASFLERRENELSKLLVKVKSTFELRGNARMALNAKMNIIEMYAGIKKRNEAQALLENKRRQYCEYFLPPDLQHLHQVSPIIKRHMLAMYVKKCREKYQHEYELYTTRLRAWQELRENQKVLKDVTHDLVSSLGSAAGSKYLARQLDKLTNKLEEPSRPQLNLVLPRTVMQQIIQKAVEHSMRITKETRPKSPKRGQLKTVSIV